MPDRLGYDRYDTRERHLRIQIYKLSYCCPYCQSSTGRNCVGTSSEITADLIPHHAIPSEASLIDGCVRPAEKEPSRNDEGHLAVRQSAIPMGFQKRQRLTSGTAAINHLIGTSC